MWYLGRCPHRQAPGRIPLRDDASSLQRRPSEPLVVKRSAHDQCGRGEDAIDVTVHVVAPEIDVAGNAVVYPHGILPATSGRARTVHRPAGNEDPPCAGSAGRSWDKPPPSAATGSACLVEHIVRPGSDVHDGLTLAAVERDPGSVHVTGAL